MESLKHPICFGYGLSTEEDLLLVEGLHADYISILAIDPSDWLGQVTFDRYEGEGILSCTRLCSTPTEKVKWYKQLKTPSTDGSCTTVTHTDTADSFLDTVSGILGELATVKRANKKY